ncbi:Na(+)/glucose symporter [Limihaloglobus sulfuriphilus]|uniref:Na(+)/glucose symporter n=1 Tax=Limihaloglobus sulfuriphilus TaxID=1851148 RepID=A0A1Q2MAZ6_9BACT|nr:sodium:solute symporter [Limihaloglobus sulfuriphilus]AQQ69844.1 Na(+)/glucose symporter [Limihaloglobus sulfuriphilus]
MFNTLLAVAETESVINFRLPDIIVILIFLIGMALVGVYFSRKNNSTEEYFLGNRSFPGWAIGISMLGTSISSVTFLALPAAAYVLDYRNIIPNLTLPIVAVFAIIFFIPYFRERKITSAFEFLEHRFSHWVRLYASLSFVFLQLLRLSTVLYLVSIPIAFITGQHIILVIIIGGIFISFYTVLGGIEAVIWTDVVQTIILLGGGIVCFGVIVTKMPEGLSQIIDIGLAHDKFSIGSFELNLNERTFFTMLLIGLIGFTTEYSSNQNVIQRYIAAKSMREARKATAICAILSVPTWLSFFFLGTCLFAIYKVFPDQAVANMDPDQVLPYFILTQIPAGVAGLIIAACLAAAMSSLDSSINAISTLVTVDFLKRYISTERDDTYYLKMAKTFAMIAGTMMILGAIAFHFIPRESIVDLGFILSSVFGGCILGIFLLGFFVKRIDNFSIITGMAAAIALNLYLMMSFFGWLPAKLTFVFHEYWTAALVNITLVVVACGTSLFRSPKTSTPQT